MRERQATGTAAVGGGRRAAGGLDRAALKAAGVFGVLAALWIGVTDRVLSAWVLEPEALTRLQTVKGWVFVGVCSALVYVLTRRVTESAERERAVLERSEGRYRLLLDHPRDVMLLVDGSGVVTYANAAAERLLGWSREELVGSVYAEVVHPGDREAVRSAIEAAGAGPAGVARVEYRVRHGEGGWRHHEAVASYFPGQAAGESAVLVSSRDITDRRAAERARRAATRNLRALVEAMPLAIVVLDRQERVRVWNPAAERLFGWRASEVLGRRYPVVGEAEREDAEARLAATLAGRPSVGDEVVRRRRDGGLVQVRVSTAPLRDRRGRIRSVLAVLEDVTEQRALEAQLRQAQKMEAIGRLAGGVAHDFNNLLTGIRGYASFVASGLPAGDPLYEDAREIVRTVDRAAAVTRQLLAFGRRQILQPMELDLGGAVTELQKMLQRLIGEDIELETRVAPGQHWIRADPVQIQQVLLNLIVNARDAMPQGGRVTIEVSDGVGPEPRVLLTVTDTGVGMAPEVQERIFEPFFTTKEPGKGTGLGLAVVYGIVKQSGGEVRVQSVEGAGSTFEVSFPRVEPGRERGEEAGTAEEARSAGTGEILLVEDEELVRRVAARTLREAGYPVVEAASGEEALRLAGSPGRRPPALVITDAVMPGMGGLTLIGRLREQWPSTRFLLISGYAEEVKDHASAAALGVSFLEKPFPPEVLVQRVVQALA